MNRSVPTTTQLPDPSRVFPRSNDPATVYLKNVVDDPAILVGDYTIYNDVDRDPRAFQKNNVLYHYPINRERLIIGRFCSIGRGAKFLFTSANHTLRSASTYPFPIFFEEWGLPVARITEAWDNKGDIVVGSDVWLGFESVVLQGVRIGDGAIVAARAVVTKDVEPYSIVAGTPAKTIRRRFDDKTIERLQRIAWFDWPAAKIRRHLDAIQRADVDALERAAQSDD